MNNRIKCLWLSAFLLLFAQGGDAAAEDGLKKKVALGAFSKPAAWAEAYDPGKPLAAAIELAVREQGKHLVAAAAAAALPMEIKGADKKGGKINFPAQVIVQGKITEFYADKPAKDENTAPSKPVTRKREHAVLSVELEIVNPVSHGVLARKNITAESTAGRAPFNAAGLSGGTGKEAMAVSSMSLAVAEFAGQAASFIDETMMSMPFRAVIIAVDGEKSEVIINAGMSQGLRVRDKFHVLAIEGVFHDPASQADLGEKITPSGIVKVKSVYDNYAVADIIAGADFQEGFFVQPRYDGAPQPGKKPWWEF